jgi:predicted  nucleic acid-binding Zn-ribbon protein
MTQVNSLQSSVYVAATPLSTEMRSLSSEAMLAYCETRLNDIDQGINAQMADQTAIMDRRKALNSALAKVKAYEAPKPETREKIYQAIDKYAASLPEKDPMRKKLEGIRATYEKAFAKVDDDKAKLKAKWTGFQSDLQAMNDEMGVDSEMSMMKLQSIVSQRQTLVSLITNIMAKLEQGAERIVNNIK